MALNMRGCQFGAARYENTIGNRTGQSGGSVGGVKKAGTWGGNTWMTVYNIGNAYSYRAPQRQPSLKQLFLFTTRNPLQLPRNGYSVTHSGTLLG
jgi:hypothetical protein